MSYTDPAIQTALRSRLAPPRRPPVDPSLAARSQGMNKQYGLGQYATPKPPAAPKPGPTAPRTPVGSPYDVNADPVLAQIRALTGRQRGDLQAGATNARTQLGIQYGDENLARQYGGDSYAQAAHDNPFSVAAELARSYKQGGQQIDESLNQDNLFYSGTRAKALGEHAFDYQRQTAQAEAEKQQRLSQIAAELAGQFSGLDQQDITGLTEANARALEQSLKYGINPGAGAPTEPVAPPPPGSVLEELLRKNAGAGRRTPV